MTVHNRLPGGDRLSRYLAALSAGQPAAQAPGQPPKAQPAGVAEASPDLAPPVEVVALPTGAEDAADSSTLFVKNLAFATSDAGLQVLLVTACRPDYFHEQARLL